MPLDILIVIRCTGINLGKFFDRSIPIRILFDVAWLGYTCYICKYCLQNKEKLCGNANLLAIRWMETMHHTIRSGLYRGIPTPAHP